MKLNTKIRYGIRTMVELAMNSGTIGIFQKDIAVKQKIPLKYLDKIITDLKSAGLIINVSGKRSGYMLAKSAEKISVNDIYKAFEGRLSIIQCLNNQTNCCKENKCASQEFWADLNSEMEQMMQKQNLKSLATKQIELDSTISNSINYHI